MKSRPMLSGANAMFVNDRRSGMSLVIAAALAVIVIPATLVGATETNLLANGDFETDTDSDGVPDGWLSHPHHFSRESLQQAQDYIAKLPSHEELLAGDRVLASDGWAVAQRQPDGKFGAYLQTAEWYRRMTDEYLPQESRFGQLPVPAELELGKTTLVVHNLKPYEQTISEPIRVKPDTGYRLSYWFRMSGGSEEALVHILGADVPRNELETLHDGQIISGINLGWAWVPYWQRYEIAFRTGPDVTSIRLRPWKYFRGYDDPRRAWYDSFRLVEDDTVLVGTTGGASHPEPKWPLQAIERGFAVVPRPTLPLTYDHYEPLPAENDQPLVITAAAGQFASGVLFIKALTDLNGPLVVGPKGRPQLNGPDGMFLWAPTLVQYRVCHPMKIDKNRRQWEMRPHFLMPGARPEAVRHNTRAVDVVVPKGEGRSVWVTAFVPNDTPPGDYQSEIHLVASGKDYVGYADKPGNNDGHAIPFTVRVRDIELLEPDATFGMYSHTSRPPQLPPSVDYRGYIDQRLHGMNSVDQGGRQVWRYTDSQGTSRVNFSAFDYDMDRLVGAGFTKNFFYYPYDDALQTDVQLAILEHCRAEGFPEPLFYVHDEPGAQGAELVPIMEEEFGAARRQGLRTVTSGLDWRTQGEAYDVWILDLSVVGSPDWPDIQARAAELGAEVWAYDCSMFINTHPRNMRFYTGLWTWAAGLQGNWIWEYGAGNPSESHGAYSASDTIPPKMWYPYGFAFSIPSGQAACVSWEARRDGVNDYRYLHSLERAVEAAVEVSKENMPSVVAARKFLEDLRARVPLDAFSYRNRESTAQKQFQQVAAGIPPEAYDALQETCATHMIAITNECGL